MLLRPDQGRPKLVLKKTLIQTCLTFPTERSSCTDPDAEVRFVVGDASKRGRTKASLKLAQFRSKVHVFALDVVRFAEAELALFGV
jgi:hypothetical protein